MSNIADTQTPTTDPAGQAAIEREREKAAGTDSFADPAEATEEVADDEKPVAKKAAAKKK